MTLITTPEQWWATLEEHKANILKLIDKYHPGNPIRYKAPEEQIDAQSAEFICKIVRKQIAQACLVISPGEDFAKTIKIKNHHKAIQYLNETWWGLPESYEVRSEPGFHVLCDLCSEAWVFYEEAN